MKVRFSSTSDADGRQSCTIALLLNSFYWMFKRLAGIGNKVLCDSLFVILCVMCSYV